MSSWFHAFTQRQDINLNSNWQTSLENTNQWKHINVPHNWDDYYGYRRLTHGNLHANAIYKKNISIKHTKIGKRFFLFFEGVGTYASIFLNNKKVGEHAGGRTTFTIDITNELKTDGTKNELKVLAAHPANIQDLPWVCGGCSNDRGFSEGSQPLGIFRPVHLIIANNIRIEPFGVHAWADIKKDVARLNMETNFKNYSSTQKNICIEQKLIDATGKIIKEIKVENVSISTIQNSIAKQYVTLPTTVLNLWSPTNPYLYKIITSIKKNNVVVDKVETDLGFRTLNWNTPSHQFLVNDKPVFINGIGEYEHLLGQSHAFSNEQIEARLDWLQNAGFNALRDAHQPHNLLYGKLCNSRGILWWTQFSAHVWYDTKLFKNNFKQLLKEWVIERRNDPSVILWGLQNESKLPEDFAKECTELIRSLDPTASTQRLVTTCNGGSGTDWDVPQNWTGTYGGNPATYADDLKKQILIGEYGAWRTLDLHSEGGVKQNGILSEDRATQLLEQKIRLAESVKDSAAGQFLWLLNSHDNPGRIQGGEGLREMDRIGPVNFKGLLTNWEEPTDAYYMYQSNYTNKNKKPMVYIVSHTWPNRWMKPGIKDSIYVFSNCDEVELFNDIDNESLGRKKRNGIGTHFQWDKVNIKYNILYAIGYVNGKPITKDTLVLMHLPKAPNFEKLYSNKISLLNKNYLYYYRVNCGGGVYIDEDNNNWTSDINYLKTWTDDFKEMPKNFANQRRTFAPITNTKDWKLFQTFRYGKDKFKYEFTVNDGEYKIDLFFVEPWVNAKGLRIFDVGVNGKMVIDDLDIYKEVGKNTLLKKTVSIKVKGGKIIIDFPETKVGQALISAIAISKFDTTSYNEPTKFKGNSMLDIGDKVYKNEEITINTLPSNLYGAETLPLLLRNENYNWKNTFTENKDLFIGFKNGKVDSVNFKDFENSKTQMITDENGGTNYEVYRKRFKINESISLQLNENIFVCMQPVSNMQPAYDLKPINQYKVNIAKYSEGIVKENFQARECAVVKSKTIGTIEYPINFGVADGYSFTIKYFYAGEKPLKAKLQLISSGNTMMQDELVEFTFTLSGKWNQFTINTNSMINAGNYKLVLNVENAEGLVISGIDVQ